ncbi:NrsF family protein [Erythrobacter dokdonensis]|uniref:Extracytoplasmic function alternative sigma factor n=1 Tax=Erythrobacter dokdonensis DSW-74 TaxID=1300349 RepID=A0A1A7BHJ5_9SPHN|nr:DUF1109 domain-containing protein [Erythrobacter dokdonensis]OBV11954.1 extracytoplasmic function alternative sigma factor [Erythrobacter dokdonensis DSW-74]
MTSPANDLIAELVGNLEPVKPLSFTRGLGYTLAAAGVSAAGIAVTMGVRPDLFAGKVDPVFLLSAGLFLVLGIAAAATVIVMSRPQVGNDHGGWVWAAAMAGLLPVAALIVAMAGASDPLSRASIAHGLDCLTIGGAASLLVFTVLVAWLRKGAPTSPERAGLLSGIAAGSLGIFAFSLHCADNDIVHIGLWHSAVVVIAAAIGRSLVPRLVRW